MSKRILYIASRDFLPVVGGRERMISQSVKWLAQVYDVTLAIFHKDEIEDVGAYSALGVKDVSTIRLNGFWPFLICLLQNPNFSAQECLYYSRSNLRILRSLVEKVRPDVVVFDMLRTACLAADIQVQRKYLEMDDLLSDRYLKFIQEANTENALGTFSNKVPSLMAKIFYPFQRKLISREGRALRVAELRAPERFDIVFLTSHLEARSLTEATGAINVHALPPSVKIAPPIYDEQQRFMDFSKTVNAIFIGNMRTQQNKDSLRYIVREIFSRLESDEIKIKLSVVGVFDEEFKNEIELEIPSDRVEFLGFVADLHGIIKANDFALMPIAHGTGICTKILEVMMHGLPVLTNKNGVRGLDVVHSRDFLCFESLEEFIEVIGGIKSGIHNLNSIARSGRSYVIDNFEDSKLSIEYISKFN